MGLTSSQRGCSEKSQSTLVLPCRPLDFDLILLLATHSTVGMDECKVAATLCRTQSPNKLIKEEGGGADHQGCPHRVQTGLWPHGGQSLQGAQRRLLATRARRFSSPIH